MRRTYQWKTEPGEIIRVKKLFPKVKPNFKMRIVEITEDSGGELRIQCSGEGYSYYEAYEEGVIWVCDEKTFRSSINETGISLKCRD